MKRDEMSRAVLTRRDFAKFVTVGSIGLAFLGGSSPAQARPLSPQWWLELHTDGRIRMLTTKVEMGQGAHAGLRTLLAEELDVAPERIEVVQVESDPRYGQIITGGSFTLYAWQERLRRAGATARHLLITAAAGRLSATAGELSTAEGTVVHTATGRALPYAALVADAALLPAPAPEDVRLKPASAWRSIGKPVRMTQDAGIVAGTARYGIDLRLPGLCYATLARAPVLNARLTSHDDSAARKIDGFIQSVVLRGNEWPQQNHVRDAVAIVARDSWIAQRAREATRVEWRLPSMAAADAETRFGVLRRAIDAPGFLTHAHGERPEVLEEDVIVEATCQQAYLAHAPLEPPNATAGFVDGRLHVWTGNQRQTRLKDAIVAQCGLPADRVVVHTALIGGSFGRRLEVDYGIEAAKLCVALQRPVHVLWTRDDDLQYGLYRPGSMHGLRAVVRNGRVISLEHRMAAESVFGQQEPAQIAADGSDWTMAAPQSAMLYEVPHVRLEHRPLAAMSPCAWWRGTYWNSVTVAVECLMDEIAERAQQDPLALRLAHLGNEPREFVVNAETKVPFDPRRMRRVLEALAQRANWNAPATAGTARGLACGIYDSPECHAAVVAEMTLRDGQPVLTRATVAVDVGTAVNPNIVEAQAIGGFIMGASAALREQVTWRDGRVQQSGYHDYRIMRFAEAPPAVDVVIVPSDAGMCGIGEIVTPAAMAAVSNAMSRLIGRRVRTWPIVPNLT